MRSEKRVAVVSGGAKRVGLAITEKLVAEGFSVLITYNRSAQAAEAVVARHQGSVTAVQANLGDPEALAEAIEAIAGAVPERLDLLVNNASVYEPSSLAKTDLTQMRRLMTIHYEAPLLLAQRLGPRLRESRGHVVNMVDLLAERPWAEYLAYCASKAALMNLTLGLARELAPEVTVNGIAPGVVEWPPGYPQAEQEKYLRRVPLQRAGTPEDVAALVHFLATGGSYITGQIIRLDGGRSIT